MRQSPHKQNGVALRATAAPRKPHPGPYRVAVWVGLHDRKCLEKLRGLDAAPWLSQGLLFRRYPVPGLSNFRQVCPSITP